MAISGTLEVLTNNGTQSTGLVVKAVEIETVPTILAAVFGFTTIGKRGTKKRPTAVAEWTARTPTYDTAEIVLWEGAD